MVRELLEDRVRRLQALLVLLDLIAFLPPDMHTEREREKREIRRRAGGKEGERTYSSRAHGTHHDGAELRVLLGRQLLGADRHLDGPAASRVALSLSLSLALARADAWVAEAGALGSAQLTAQLAVGAGRCASSTTLFSVWLGQAPFSIRLDDRAAGEIAAAYLRDEGCFYEADGFYERRELEAVAWTRRIGRNARTERTMIR